MPTGPGYAFRLRFRASYVHLRFFTEVYGFPGFIERESCVRWRFSRVEIAVIGVLLFREYVEIGFEEFGGV